LPQSAKFRGGWLGTAKIKKKLFMNFTSICENSEMTNQVGLERAVVIC